MQGKRMKVCDPMAGALSGRSQVRKPCRTRQRAGPQSRLLTDLGHKEASCVSPDLTCPVLCEGLFGVAAFYGWLGMAADFAPLVSEGVMTRPPERDAREAERGLGAFGDWEQM